MCRSRKSRSKSAWAKAREPPSFGSPASSPAVFCLKWTAFQLPSRRKRWRSLPPSCPSRPDSLNASPSDAMKAADARAMTLDQLDDEVLKLKKEQFNLRFQRATGQLENTSRVRTIRRDIARMKTIAAQKRGGTPEPASKADAMPAPAKKVKATKPKAAAKPKSSRAKVKSKE